MTKHRRSPTCSSISAQTITSRPVARECRLRPEFWRRKTVLRPTPIMRRLASNAIHAHITIFCVPGWRSGVSERSCHVLRQESRDMLVSGSFCCRTPSVAEQGGTADRNRSHRSTFKTPSYTKSVSWHHQNSAGKTAAQAFSCGKSKKGDVPLISRRSWVHSIKVSHTWLIL